VLVAHHSATKVLAVQKELVAALEAAGHGDRLMHIPVTVTNVDLEPVETTQRSRSFLFASLAFVVAQMFGRDGFTFYENGVISLNLPIAHDVLGARATRTTHPKDRNQQPLPLADEGGGDRTHHLRRVRQAASPHGELRSPDAVDHECPPLRALLPMHRPAFRRSCG
jgi:hypothetical protein